MSFCCGSEMLLTIASIRQENVTILNVPMLFCVTCEKLMIHPDIEFEFDMLKNFACGDRAQEVDLEPHIHPRKKAQLYDSANHAESLKMDKILQDRMDQALDLFTIALELDDPAWKEEIKGRLHILKQKSSKGRVSH